MQGIQVQSLVRDLDLTCPNKDLVQEINNKYFLKKRKGNIALDKHISKFAHKFNEKNHRSF